MVDLGFLELNYAADFSMCAFTDLSPRARISTCAATISLIIIFNPMVLSVFRRYFAV